ncbi:MAG: hypothetical protein V8R39_06775 [Clostridia bacterium]
MGTVLFPKKNRPQSEKLCPQHKKTVNKQKTLHNLLKNPPKYDKIMN